MFSVPEIGILVIEFFFFLGNRKTSNSSLYAWILSENIVPDFVPDVVSLYGSLDDIVSWSMEDFAGIYDKNLH